MTSGVSMISGILVFVTCLFVSSLEGTSLGPHWPISIPRTSIPNTNLNGSIPAFSELMCFKHSSITPFLAGCHDPIQQICTPPIVRSIEQCYHAQDFGGRSPYHIPLNWEAVRPSGDGHVCRVEFLKRDMRRRPPITLAWATIRNAASIITEGCQGRDQKRGGILFFEGTDYYVQVAMDYLEASDQRGLSRVSL